MSTTQPVTSPPAEVGERASSSSVLLLTGWCFVFAAAASLYAATASHGAQWQDSGQHIMRILDGQPVHVLGLALSHPLHYWLGRAAVRLDFVAQAYAITLVSSFAAAIAAANVFGIVFSLTRRLVPGGLAAASLVVAHTFWQMATVAEVYTLSAAMLSAEIWCVVSYGRSQRAGFLILAAGLNGLALSNHNVALLTTPILAAVVAAGLYYKRIRFLDIAIAAIAWLLGSAPYTGMVLEVARRDDVWVTLHSALFGNAYADEVLNPSFPARRLVLSAGFVALNFPNLMAPVAVYGMGQMRRLDIPTIARRVLLAALLMHMAFVVRYEVADQYTFFLPAYTLLAVFGGIGLAAIQKKGSRPSQAILLAVALTIALTPPVYAVAPAIAKRWGVLHGKERFKPYRNDYDYLLTPWSGLERSAERMTTAALAAAGDNGLIVVPDTTSLSAVRYEVLRSGNHSVTVADDLSSPQILDAFAAGRSVVFVPISTAAGPPAAPVGEWRRIGDLYVVRIEFRQPRGDR